MISNVLSLVHSVCAKVESHSSITIFPFSSPAAKIYFLSMPGRNDFANVNAVTELSKSKGVEQAIAYSPKSDVSELIFAALRFSFFDQITIFLSLEPVAKNLESCDQQQHHINL